MSNISTISVKLPRLIVPKRHVDDRGWFSENFHQERLRDIGITCRFVQDNQSSSKHTGTLRGLHFQLPPAAQAKLVTVVKGRILDVAVDIRRGSPTFGKYVSTELELSSETGLQLYIPVGFAGDCGYCNICTSFPPLRFKSATRRSDLDDPEKRARFLREVGVMAIPVGGRRFARTRPTTLICSIGGMASRFQNHRRTASWSNRSADVSPGKGLLPRA